MNLCNNHNCETKFHSTNQSIDEVDFLRSIQYYAQIGDLQKLQTKVHLVNSVDSYGYTALHYAARSGHIDCCLFLLKNAADMNFQTSNLKTTALHRCCNGDKLNVFKLLLEYKADYKLKTVDSKNFLHVLFENNSTSILNFIFCNEFHTIIKKKLNDPQCLVDTLNLGNNVKFSMMELKTLLNEADVKNKKPLDYYNKQTSFIDMQLLEIFMNS